jgi:hypothetical protein
LGVIRTPNTGFCVNQVLSNEKMNSKEIISLREFSQIVAATNISSFLEEHILAAAKNLSISPEILEGPKFPELQNILLAKMLSTQHTLKSLCQFFTFWVLLESVSHY